MFGSILPRSPLDHYLLVGNGGEGGSEGGDGGGSGGGDGGQGGGSDKTFTQTEVNQMVQERLARQQRSSAENIAKDLGMSVEEAKTFIAEAKKKADADKDEVTREKEAAAKEKADAEKAKADAATERLQTNVEKALVRAGLQLDEDESKADERLGRIARMVDVQPGADADAIKAAVEALKKSEPAIFGATNGKPPPGDPPGKPRKTSHNETSWDRGKERAEQYAKTSSSGVGDGIGGYDLPSAAR